MANDQRAIEKGQELLCSKLPIASVKVVVLCFQPKLDRWATEVCCHSLGKSNESS